MGGPYIFISYSRRDWEQIEPILLELEKQGYTLWYDKKGIHAGEQWTDRLAETIAACALVMPFLSANFYQSDACLQELRHARHNKRPRFPVWLDREEIPQNCKYLLEDYQGTRFSESDTPETFAARLENQDLFQSCRRKNHPSGDAPSAPPAPAEIVTLSQPAAPSAAFTGREDRIRDLETALQTETAVALCGMGGLGKSEICRKLFRDYTQGVGTNLCRKTGWLIWRGSLKATVYGQFPEIKEENAERYLLAVKNLLNREGRDLLLFLDNADDLTEQEAVEVTALGCRVLLTSRKRFERIYSIGVGQLTWEQCRLLYRRSAGDGWDDASPDGTLDEILRLAGRHTLTVELLAKTRNAEGLTDRELLEKLQQSGFNLSDVEITCLPYPEQREGYEEEQTFINHMSRVFNIAGIADNPAALRALQGMSLLATNTPVAKRTVKQWLGLESLNGLNRAARAGWLEQTRENGVPSVSIHPVIAAVVWKNARPDAAVVDAVAGELGREIYVDYSELHTPKLPILPHAIAVARRARRLSLCTRNYGFLLHRIGFLLYSQGDYSAALKRCQDSAAIEEIAYGREHEETATTYNDIGLICSDMGNDKDAMEWYRKALRIREKILGTEHQDTAISYHNIGAVYEEMGNHPAALEWMKKAMLIFERVLGKEHPNTATSYHNIGFIYTEMGDYPASLEWHQKALRIRENVLGKEHPDTADSYHNIGYTYAHMGDYPAALEWLQKALQIVEKVLGEEHPNTAIAYSNIGIIYLEQGDSTEALHWLEKAYPILQKVYGPEHPYTQRTQKRIDDTKVSLPPPSP